MSRRFVRRAVLFFITFVLLFALLVAALVWLLLSLFGSGTTGGVPGTVLAAFFLLVVSFSVARGVRRLIVPLGDLIEAAERVKSGDYSVRVRVRGPRELRALAGAFNDMSARLESSEAERRRLLADVTHELRTPLTVMQGNVEALIDGVYPADAAHLETILEETRVLSRLVDDLRTLSMAEAGALDLHREPTDLATLIEETLASFRPEADRAGVTLEHEVGTAPPVDADPVRTRMVLANLVANALRYTPSGGRVRVGTSPDGDGVAVRVRDTGTGIPAEALGRIFERFYKSDDSRGAGLGLAIAKSLVTAQGGEISASSEPGRGTEIRFTLPGAPRPGAAAS